MPSEENRNIISCIILANIQNQVDCIKSLADETGTMYVIYNLERSGRLVNNLHYVYSELVSNVLFQRSRARLYIIWLTPVAFSKCLR